MRFPFSLAALALVAPILLAAPVTALAQVEPAAPRPQHIPPPLLPEDTAVVQQAQPQPPNCWRPRPIDICPGFFLTEFGVELPLLTTHSYESAGRPRGRDFEPRVVWSFGFMGTKGRHSHGGALSFIGEAGSDALGYSVEYRYRNWLNRSAAVDGALGYKRAQVWTPGEGLVPGHGVTAMAAITPNRFIGISLRGDFVNGGGRVHRALSVGVQSGWLSEKAIKFSALAIARAALGAIGIELEDEEQ